MDFIGGTYQYLTLCLEPTSDEITCANSLFHINFIAMISTQKSEPHDLEACYQYRHHGVRTRQEMVIL